MIPEIEQKQDFNIKIYADKRKYIKTFFGCLFAIFLFEFAYITANGNVISEVISFILLLFFSVGIFILLIQIFRKDPVFIINKIGVEDRLSPFSISTVGLILWKNIKYIKAPNEDTEQIIKNALGKNTLELSDIVMMIVNASNRKLMFPHTRKSMISTFAGLNHVGIVLKDRRTFLQNKNRYLQWRINTDAKTMGIDILVYYSYMNINSLELYLYIKYGLEKYGSPNNIVD